MPTCRHIQKASQWAKSSQLFHQHFPAVNFINILSNKFFVRMLFWQLFLWLCSYIEKLPKRRSYEKLIRKMLMKLTPSVDKLQTKTVSNLKKATS